MTGIKSMAYFPLLYLPHLTAIFVFDSLAQKSAKVRLQLQGLFVQFNFEERKRKCVKNNITHLKKVWGNVVTDCFEKNTKVHIPIEKLIYMLAGIMFNKL